MSVEKFCLAFGELERCLIGQKGSNFNLRVSKNKFQSIHFACMNNNLFHLGKQSLPIQIACL
jgi:hypothetical protein